MAENFEHIDGFYRPLFICDACQQPITDFRNAKVIYESPSDDVQDLTNVLHCHKKDSCEAAVLVMAKQKGLNGFWQELHYHLILLAASAGMSLDDLTHAYKHLSQRSLIP